MADITKCYGKDCPIKDNCYRFTAPASFFQYFFIEVPYKEDKCEHFWDNERREERRNKRKR